MSLDIDSELANALVRGTDGLIDSHTQMSVKFIAFNRADAQRVADFISEIRNSARGLVHEHDWRFDSGSTDGVTVVKCECSRYANQNRIRRGYLYSRTIHLKFHRQFIDTFEANCDNGQ